MHQSTSGERITAAISTIVAIAILSAAVTAQQGRAPTSDRLASLESDLRFQLDLAFQQDRPAYRARLAEVDAALAAWRAAPRTDRSNRLLEDWLRKALSRTMPGRNGQLPPRPQFGAEPQPLTTTGASTLASTATPSNAANANEPLPESTPAAPGPMAPAQPTLEVVELSRDGEPVGEPRVLEFEPVAPIVVKPAKQILLGDSDAAEPEAKATGDPPAAEAIVAATPAPAEPAPAVAEAPAEHSIARHATPSPDTAAPPAPVQGAATPAPPVAEPIVERPARAASFARPSQPPAVTVNLAELNARIGGFHQELSDVEAAVVAGRLTHDQLASLVARLEALARQQQFVQLYFDALTPQERRRVAAPRPMDEAIALVAAQVAKTAESADLLDDFDASGNASATLAERLQFVADAVGVASDR
jgi:hypothetical protein